jgi:hypothetical protein
MNRKQTRAELIGMTKVLLAGPMSDAEVLDSSPADTYLTGILWPRGTVIDAADDDSREEAANANGDEVEAGIPGYRVNRPCSVGLTFAVDTGVPLNVDLGRTARYLRSGSANETEPKEASSGVVASAGIRWTRKQLGYRFVLDPSTMPAESSIRDFIDSHGAPVRDDTVSVHVRHRAADDQVIWTLTLINETPDVRNDESAEHPCLFQTELVLSAHLNGRGCIRPRRLAATRRGDQDARTNALLYRDVREFAIGHGIATVWSAPSDGTVSEVRTDWLPAVEVKGTSARGSDMLQPVVAAHSGLLRASFLGDESKRVEIIAALRAFAECYGQWIDLELRFRLPNFEGADRDTALANMERCGDTLARMSAGIDALESDAAAFAAFALSNRAMDRQSGFPSKGEKAGALIWRPFQLAFFLLVVRGLVDPATEDRSCMDLLWFPTGGGKTEAYLALTAFQIFHRRLVEEDRRIFGGVDVLMRYTLRLLTVQQFQRAAALIVACDLIRQKDERLGSVPITLGLYVGGDATPNRMDAARGALQEEKLGNAPKSTPRQLLRCPVCGGDLQSSNYHAHETAPQIDIVCLNAACEVRNMLLPVMTVDDVLYASPPSLLIGTVDKFAQLPRNTALRSLFGLDSSLRPGLIIQDELHLISGPLGSMAGLYETVIDLLCTKDGIRPKIIGSTATIGRAEQQVKALFDRSVLQFPPPGFDAADSFFAVRDDSEDRTYVGLSSAGRSPKFALQALVAALLQGASTIRAGGSASDDAIDPYWTCVAYFNSLRELGGAWVLMQDDVPRQMRFLASRLGAVQRKLELEPEELSSRVSSRELPQVLQSLEVKLGGGSVYDEPRDTVLASNMISVGVDVPRLGLMVVNGQPKSTAEYIQASSRIGRGLPGLVFTLYNVGRPRDLSHLEHFCSYHGALYRNVEASSVTPWAPRARDKALHAVVVAAMRHLIPGLADDDAAIRFDPAMPGVAEIVAAISARATATAVGVDRMDAVEDVAEIVARWARRAMHGRDANSKLGYWERPAPFGKTAPHLMSAAETGLEVGSLSWPTPNSMREVEPSTAFLLKRIPPKGDR